MVQKRVSTRNNGQEVHVFTLDEKLVTGALQRHVNIECVPTDGTRRTWRSVHTGKVFTFSCPVA